MLAFWNQFYYWHLFSQPEYMTVAKRTYHPCNPVETTGFQAHSSSSLYPCPPTAQMATDILIHENIENALIISLSIRRVGGHQQKTLGINVRGIM